MDNGFIIDLKESKAELFSYGNYGYDFKEILDDINEEEKSFYFNVEPSLSEEEITEEIFCCIAERLNICDLEIHQDTVLKMAEILYDTYYDKIYNI